ncbi:hypothetical protein MNBD_ALPHA04-2411 [hydrothermal vent metagenome]|uniref:HTH tetR-type domain-containing protein n=1 Tax=hydrothermal vent metagenome TaxID=652676 RepID=A0A3B0TAW7_9ZZZZ
MSRPQTDIEAGREKLVETAEQIIRERGAITFTIADLAAEAGMSQSNVYRFFASKDALAEEMAGRWFADKTAIMEKLVEEDIPVREKLYAFFARRLAVMQQRFDENPELFAAYMELGDLHFEVIRGYVDLADHYMAIILAEAMEEGYFRGLELDMVVSLVNMMVQPFCNPRVMMMLNRAADEEKLRLIIDAIFDGLHAPSGQTGETELHLAG